MTPGLICDRIQKTKVSELSKGKGTAEIFSNFRKIFSSFSAWSERLVVAWEKNPNFWGLSAELRFEGRRRFVTQIDVSQEVKKTGLKKISLKRKKFINIFASLGVVTPQRLTFPVIAEKPRLWEQVSQETVSLSD